MKGQICPKCQDFFSTEICPCEKSTNKKATTEDIWPLPNNNPWFDLFNNDGYNLDITAQDAIELESDD